LTLTTVSIISPHPFTRRRRTITTICYRDGVLAADTLIAYNTYTNGHRDKIAECGNYLVALAGAVCYRRILEKWVKDGCHSDEVPADLLNNTSEFSALLVDRVSGRAYEFDDGHLVPIYADYTAIGSGTMLALGALAAGATAEEAVEAASLHDKNTGGPVTTYDLNLTK